MLIEQDVSEQPTAFAWLWGLDMVMRDCDERLRASRPPPCYRSTMPPVYYRVGQGQRWIWDRPVASCVLHEHSSSKIVNLLDPGYSNLTPFSIVEILTMWATCRYQIQIVSSWPSIACAADRFWLVSAAATMVKMWRKLVGWQKMHCARNLDKILFSTLCWAVGYR